MIIDFTEVLGGCLNELLLRTSMPLNSKKQLENFRTIQSYTFQHVRKSRSYIKKRIYNDHVLSSLIHCDYGEGGMDPIYRLGVKYKSDANAFVDYLQGTADTWVLGVSNKWKKNCREWLWSELCPSYLQKWRERKAVWRIGEKLPAEICMVICDFL
jgi:hypothetical protein